MNYLHHTIKRNFRTKGLLLLTAMLAAMVSTGQSYTNITTYTYTGASQVYTVPSGINIIQVELWGAQGQSNGSSTGGSGGYIKGNLSVSPGQTLLVTVGGQNGFNGGGSASNAGNSGGGGGASDIRQNGTGLSHRVAVAGGGGGGSVPVCNMFFPGGYGGYPGGQGGFGCNGYAGSGTSSAGGSSGGGCNALCNGIFLVPTAAGGGGGGQTGGGAQGGWGIAAGGINGSCGSTNSNVIGSTTPTPGISLGAGCVGQGGKGGATTATAYSFNGGGGGGGWYGGGGGGSNEGSGGGGGSSYLGSLSNSSYSNGIQTGNGQVVIKLLFTGSETHKNVSCYGLSNGSATVTATNILSSGPFSYSWIPSGGVGSIATGLAAGTYTCLLANGGNTVENIVVITQPPPIVAGVSASNSVTCFGGTNGAVTLTVSGGVSPYQFNWVSGGSGSSLSNLSAGNYTCTITDANACTLQQSVTIAQGGSFVVSGSASSASICLGGTTTLNGSGASSYTWSGGVVNGLPFTPTVSATYSVTGKNSAGCVGSGNSVVNITVYSLPTITVNSGAICAGKSFTINPSGATSYTFSSGSAVISPSSTGQYSVSGTNSNGCVSASPAIATVTVHPLPIVSVNSGNMCVGSSFTLVASGAQSYTYSSGSAVVSPSSSSQFSVSGTSAAGCLSAVPAIASITVNPLPVVTASSGNMCAGQSFTLSASGANTYSYSSGNAVVSPSSTTQYSISGTSLAGCISATPAVATVSVNLLPVIAVNSGSLCQGQSFSLNPSGANTYTFSSGNAVVTPTSTSQYSVLGTSLAGCISASPAIATITVYSLPTISVTSGSICAGESFTLTPSGASNYSYSGGSAVVNPTVSTNYSVAGQSGEGCWSNVDAIASITVIALPQININSGNICLGDSFTLAPTGAINYTFSSGSSVVSPSSTTQFSVIGSNAEGCLAIQVATVTVVTPPVISVNSGSICTGDSYTIAPTGAANYTYSSGSNVVSPVSTSQYSVIGSSAEGCLGSNTAICQVWVNPLPQVNASSSATMICAGESVSLTATGASSYSWSSGDLTSIALVWPNSTGVYTVSGRDENGCEAKAFVSITVMECTGIGGNGASKQTGFSLYPNPNNGVFRIEAMEDSELLVCDPFGVILERFYIKALVTQELNLSMLQRGVYFVKATHGSQRIVCKLIIDP